MPKHDFVRRDAIWAEYRDEAVSILTLAEVVAINDSFLLSKKAESLWMPLHVAAEAANIE